MNWEIHGTINQVWPAAKDRVRSETILAEAGTHRTFTTYSSDSMSCEIWTHAVHTGKCAGFLLAIGNRDSQLAAAVLIKESQWDKKRALIEADRIVRILFQGKSFRLRRSIMIELGKMSHKILNELDETSRFNLADHENMAVTMQIDSYNTFLDVEWIEDCMCGDTRILKMMNTPN